MNLGTATVLRADARHLPLEDDSVDLVVTSPPYFALRSYQDGGEHYGGQIGSEPTPAEFVAALLEVTAECVRVLKPSGSLWVNLGDKYAGGGGGPDRKRDRSPFASTVPNLRAQTWGSPTKSLIGIPWRYALACIDDLGLILRAEVIWSKPNGLPESVTDRVRRSHEQWFHMTLEPRYFSAVDEIREAHLHGGAGPTWAERKAAGSPMRHGDTSGGASEGASGPKQGNPLGKLPGSVWVVPTEPLRVPDHLGIDHFAAFPTEWPRRIIQGWSPSGVCVECGEGRRPVAIVTPVESKPFAIQQHERSPLSGGTRNQGLGYSASERDRTITGYACACTPFHYEADPRDPDRPPILIYDWHLWTPADTTPGVILDPFGGTGTTAMVAKALGRHGITVDMSADYCRLAEWRTNDRDQLAKVLGIAKVGPADAEQLDLFAEESA